MRHFQQDSIYATLSIYLIMYFFFVHDITPVHPAAPLYSAVVLCQSTLSRLLTITLLPKQFPNLLFETTLLM